MKQKVSVQARMVMLRDAAAKRWGGSENSQTVEKLSLNLLQSFWGIEFAVNFSDAKKPFMSQGHKGPPAGGPLEPFVMVEHFAM